MEDDFYFLNFKQVLVVLTSKTMRLDIIKFLEDREIDASIKYADSYTDAAKLIQKSQHDPYNHIILNLSFTNQKLKDFIEFITPQIQEDPKFLIQFTEDGEFNLPYME